MTSVETLFCNRVAPWHHEFRFLFEQIRSIFRLTKLGLVRLFLALPAYCAEQGL